MCLPFCSRARQQQQQRHRLYACICEFCFGFSFAAQRCQLLLLLLLLPAQQDLCAASHQHTLTRTLSHSFMHTHRGIHRLPTHSLTACFSSLSPLHCVAVAAAAAAAAALASSSTLRCPHSRNNNDNECTTTCNNMHVHEPRQRRSVAPALPLLRPESESRSHRRLCSLSLLIWVVFFFVFCKRVSCRYSASHCRTVSLVQFSREASKTCFLLKPTTPTNPNPDRAKPDQDNTDLGVEPQFGFATRFKCFLSLPSAVRQVRFVCF